MALIKKGSDSALKVLDDKQKKQWEDLIGKPFEFHPRHAADSN